MTNRSTVRSKRPAKKVESGNNTDLKQDSYQSLRKMDRDNPENDQLLRLSND